jgi:excisionase family DNA binding protein
MNIVYTGVDIYINPQLMTETPKHVIRVSVSEAAKLFGISSRTIRRAITDGQVAYIVVRGRYKINFESLVKWSQARATVRNKLASTGIGQFVEKWRIHNRLYSPNPKIFEKKEGVEKKR